MTGTDAIATIEIDSIAGGGDGVGRVDGRVVFVPRTAPGDMARVRFTSRGRFARGVLLAVERPSPLRIEPACEHYVTDRCGGCQLQHMTMEGQQAAKVRIVGDALQRIGRRSVDDIPLRASPRAWRYRRKLTLTLRPAPSEPSGWMGGLHPFDAPDQVFPLRDCPITEAGVIDAWRGILAVADAFPDALSLRAGVQVIEGGFALVLEGGTAWPRWAAFPAAVPSVREIWWTPETGKRRRLFPEGDAPATGASFAQVNAAVGEAMHRYVVDRALSYAPLTAVDAYAGTGATAIALAERGIRVTAIEADRTAAAAARRHLPEGARVHATRVEAALGRALPADLVLLNPPRAGVDASVTEILNQATPRPRAVIYVSCDPATLARDVKRLAEYRLARVVCFDMFPQTAHVETVCELVPQDS
jgi:23S rRNA (uracil1939-C5)-methyltransferase